MIMVQVQLRRTLSLMLTGRLPQVAVRADAFALVRSLQCTTEFKFPAAKCPLTSSVERIASGY